MRPRTRPPAKPGPRLQAVRAHDHGIAICDAAGRILLLDHTAARLLGHREAHLLGRPFLSLIHPDDRATAYASYAHTVLAHQPAPARDTVDVRCGTRTHAPRVRLSWDTDAPRPGRGGAPLVVLHLRTTTRPGARQRRPTPPRTAPPAGTRAATTRR